MAGNDVAGVDKYICTWQCDVDETLKSCCFSVKHWPYLSCYLLISGVALNTATKQIILLSLQNLKWNTYKIKKVYPFKSY